MESTSGTISLTLAGVPEQVNIPINICLEQGIFRKYGIDVTFRLVPEGTGAMLNLLESGEADIALTVTDAFMVGRSNGRKVCIAGTFVESPLVWAVAGSADKKDVSTIPDLLGGQRRFGVSRMGSGSHTMAQYMCSLHADIAGSSSYVIANNFDGLKQGVQNNLFDAFLWETFTTKPSFDRGEVNKIGEVSTPWSAFSFITPQDVSAQQSEAYKRLFAALAEGSNIFTADREGLDKVNTEHSSEYSMESSEDRICREFGHKHEDAATWLSRCRYSVDPAHPPMCIDRAATNKSVDILKSIGLIPEDYPVEDLWGNSTVIQFKNGAVVQE